MISFCMSNDADFIKNNFDNQIKLTREITLFYDDMVEVREFSDYIIVFCGIQWQGEIADFIDSPAQNGQYYSIVFDKRNQSIRVITDFLEDFPIYYWIKDSKFVITNKILAFNNRVFKLNFHWLALAKHNNYIDRLLDPDPDIHGAGSIGISLYYKNITPITNVKRIGPGRILDIVDGNINISKWYDARKDYINLLNSQPKFNLASATEYVDSILTDNFKTLAKKYDSLVAFSSNGIDSLTILNYLPSIPKYGYYGENYDSESPELLKKMYSETGGVLHYFDAQEYQKAYKETLLNWAIPSRSADLAPEMYIRNKYDLHDKVIIKGTFGDEIFWHEPWSAMCVAVHQWGCTSRKHCLERLKDHYAYQPYHSAPKALDIIKKSKNLGLSIMNYHYDRQHSYLKDDRQLLNQLVISPYIDLRLRSLLPQCDLKTKLASILDAQIQRNLVDNNLNKYLNTYKAGGEESFSSINYDTHRLNQLNEFIKCRSKTY